MKHLKIQLFIAVLLFSAGTISAQEQSLTIEASQLNTAFKFISSDNSKQNKEYKGIMTGAYAIGYRHILNESIILEGGFGKRNAGADLVYDEMNYSWRMQYLDARLGAGYMYKMGKLSPYAVVSGYYAYLLQGIQVLNNEELNITESGILNRNDIGIIGNAGVNFELSKYISAFAEFNYYAGFKNIETDESQKANNEAMGFTLGLAFTITK